MFSKEQRGYKRYKHGTLVFTNVESIDNMHRFGKTCEIRGKLRCLHETTAVLRHKPRQNCGELSEDAIWGKFTKRLMMFDVYRSVQCAQCVYLPMCCIILYKRRDAGWLCPRTWESDP